MKIGFTQFSYDDAIFGHDLIISSVASEVDRCILRSVMRKIILASGSPRRKELLANLGVEFEVIPSDFDEWLDDSIPPRRNCGRFGSR